MASPGRPPVQQQQRYWVTLATVAGAPAMLTIALGVFLTSAAASHDDDLPDVGCDASHDDDLPGVGCSELLAGVLLNGGAWPSHAPYLSLNQPPSILLPRPAPDAHEVAAGRAMGKLYPERQWVPGALHLSNGSQLDAHQLRGLWAGTAGQQRCSLETLLYYVPSPEFFAWPPVRAGHTVDVHVDGGGRVVQLKTVAFAPAVFTVEGFLTHEETRHLHRQTRERATDSQTVGVSGAVSSSQRESRGAWLSADEDAIVARVQARVGELLRINLRAAPGLAEDLQLTEYTEGGKYQAHHDYYATDQPSEVGAVGRNIAVWGRNRFVTVLMYLNDVAEENGGATNFPRAMGMDESLFSPCEKPTLDCSCGASVQPRAGTAVIFYNMEVAGHAAPLPWGGARVDPLSLHAGCTVRRGSKLVAQQWVHAWFGDVPPGGVRQTQKLVRVRQADGGVAHPERQVVLAEAPLPQQAQQL